MDLMLIITEIPFSSANWQRGFSPSTKGDKLETTVAFHDGDGNLTEQIDADGNTSDFYYDALGDQTESIVGAGSGTPAVSSSFYFYCNRFSREVIQHS